MHSLTRLGSLLTLSPFVLAQQTFMSPRGFGLQEGDTEVFTSQPFYAANARYQYIDGTQVGAARPNINKVELRRRPTEVPGDYPARTVSLTLIMAHASLAAAGPTFATNYKGTLSTTVHSGSINLPDFSNGPLPMPAAWSIAVPFTTNFSYNGTDDLLIEFQCSGVNVASKQYPLDCVDAVVYQDGYAWYNSNEACTVGITSFLINNDTGPTITSGVVSLSQYGTDGPASQPGALLIGIGQLYLNLGGLFCAHLEPTLDLTLGVVTDATGKIGSSASPITLSYPFPGVVHKVFTQFVAFDQSQATPYKLAFSDDIKWTVGTVGPYSVARISATSGTTPPASITAGTRSPYYYPIMRFSN